MAGLPGLNGVGAAIV